MLASLLLADELHDLRTNIAEAAPVAAPVKDDPERRAKLRRVAARAEEIAADLTDA
jgi:cell division protein ZapA